MKKLIIFNILILFLSVLPAFSEDPLKKGQDLLKTENYLQAKEFFKAYIEDPKIADIALIGLAKAEYYLGNYYESLNALRRILRDFKNSSVINEANLFTGLNYLRLGKLNDAEFYLKKVEPPLDKQASIGIGWIHFYKKDFRTVENILSKLDKKDFENPETALLKIKYLANTGRANEALKAFNANFKLKKSAYDLDKAEILIMAKQFSEAEKTLNQVILRANKISDRIKAENMLLDLYIAQNKTEEALKLARDIYFYIPTDEFKLKLYELYLKQNNYDYALRMLLALRDRALKTKKIEELIKTLMASDPSKASDYIMKTYVFLPLDSAFLVDSANFLISQGKTTEAKNILRKLQTGPRKAEAIVPLSKILIKEGKYSEAKKLLEPIKDRNSYAMALYACVLDKEGDKASALRYLRKISKSIKDPDILTTMADLEYSIGDRKKAIIYWTEASKLGNVDATLKAADYFYLMNKTKYAMQLYKKAIDMGISDNKSLMWAYYQYGKLAKDKTYLEKVANSKGELAQAAKALLEKL